MAGSDAERLGALAVVDRLRRSRHGFVELAYDKASNRFVALWRIALRQRTREINDAWAEEMRFAQRLRHGHIMRLVDEGDRLGQLYASFEWLPGVDWQRLLEQAARQAELPSVAIAAALVAQLGDALAYLHPQSIFVQEGLEPSQLLLSFEGRAAFAAPLNWRFLGRVSPVDSDGKLVFWLAPEVRRGGEATAASDVYTLGVLLWFALTGAPHSGEPETGHTKDRLRESLLQWRVDVGNELLTVLWRALQENPRNRFSQTREMKTALRAALDGGFAPSEEIGDYVCRLFPGERERMETQLAAWRLEHGHETQPEERISTAILDGPPKLVPVAPPSLTPPPGGDLTASSRWRGVVLLLVCAAVGAGLVYLVLRTG